jgi:steroid 5-alpha reductase family enzyme
VEFLLANIVFFSIFYIIALIRDDFGIIDVAWGLSFLVLFLTGLQVKGLEIEGRLLVIGGALFFWAIRLSGYILYRNLKLNHEDQRYTEMRNGWGESIKINAYFRVYVLQALLSLIVASPLISIFYQSELKEIYSITDYIGLCLLAFGFLFESISDYQKNKFKSDINNKGKPCDKGFWKYSRHPNYFGETIFWWGIALLTITQIPFYWALLGPGFITFLLIKVSGVAMLEKNYEENNLYGEYRRVTNKFFPWTPKK